jgi:hypothetical protein
MRRSGGKTDSLTGGTVLIPNGAQVLRLAEDKTGYNQDAAGVRLKVGANKAKLEIVATFR